MSTASATKQRRASTRADTRQASKENAAQDRSEAAEKPSRPAKIKPLEEPANGRDNRSRRVSKPRHETAEAAPRGTSALKGAKQDQSRKRKEQPDEGDDDETTGASRKKNKGANNKAAPPTAAKSANHRVRRGPTPENSGAAGTESECPPQQPASRHIQDEDGGDESERSSDLSDEDAFEPDGNEDDSDGALEDVPADELNEIFAAEIPHVFDSSPSPPRTLCSGRECSPYSGNTSFESTRSSNVSRPPSSDMDEPFVATKNHSAKNPKASSKREQMFKNEVPRIIRPSADVEQIKQNHSHRRSPIEPSKHITGDSENINQRPRKGASEDEWPRHARLAGPGMKTQNVYIQAVCTRAIHLAETAVVTTHAWPELNRSAEYRFEVLMQALNDIRTSDKAYTDIGNRLERDNEFVKALGKWVIDRLPHARGPARVKGLDHIAIFQLGVGPDCVARVKALLKNDTYIYTGEWKVDKNEKLQWVVNTKEIYLNTGLINVLKSAFFATPSAFGHKFSKYYISSHETRKEPEFPASLVALAATGLYAGLYAWRDGIKAEKEKFEGDIFKSVFDNHMGYLKSIKETNALAYHVLMSTLYSKVMEGQGKNTVTENHGNPLAIADLSEFV